MSSSPHTGSPPDQVLHLPEEAAGMLNVTRHWLMQAAKKGRVPHRRLSPRVIRFADEDITEIRRMSEVPAHAELSA
ncbi:hypothetical protein [Actinoallomurus sp. CA-142502]|uniref:hypothetical protein n=1 Tax=Actinoallomurus sp. CA-142502 TaxID=3239885 RepID=UPI003D8E914F